MKNNRWKRIPLKVIKNHQDLLEQMIEKRRRDGNCWPYLCGNVIKWKYGKGA